MTQKTEMNTQVDTNITGHAVPHDSALGGMCVLFDTDAVAKMMRDRLPEGATLASCDSCEVCYVRYKPHTNCIIGYQLTHHSPDKAGESELLYAKVVIADDFADVCEKMQAKRWKRADSSPGAFIVPECNAIIYRFPNDAILEGLRALDTPKRIQRMLYQHLTEFSKERWRISDSRLKIRVVSYKPERRAVLRLQTRATELETNRRESLALYCRFYADERGRDVLRLLQGLAREHSNSAALVTPAPVDYLPDYRALMLHEIPGAVLGAPTGDARYLADVTRACAALARLHNSAPETYAHLPGFSSELFLQSLDEELSATATNLATLLPKSLSLIESLRGTIAHRMAEALCEATLVHGDFHPGQVICQAETVGIIDFDRAHVAPYISDLANLIAHLQQGAVEDSSLDIGLMRQALVESYQTASGKVIDTSALSVWVAYRLFVLAVSPFRAFRQGWSDSITALLEQVRMELA